MTDEKNPELKPCPFCGTDNVELEGKIVPPYVVCETCGAFGPSEDDTVIGGVIVWNKRADPAELTALREQRDLLVIEIRAAREAMFAVWADMKLGSTNEQILFKALQSIDDKALALIDTTDEAHS